MSLAAKIVQLFLKNIKNVVYITFFPLFAAQNKSITYEIHCYESYCTIHRKCCIVPFFSRLQQPVEL